VADLDDGFTRIANELLEALMRTKLSGTQSQVVMAVIRQTYGYRKSADRLHTGYLAELTGLDRTQVKRAVKALESRNILTIQRGSGIFYMASVNRVISEWKEDKICSESGGAELPKSGAEMPQTWSKTATSMEQNCPTTKENNKRKQQKKEKISSSQLEKTSGDADAIQQEISGIHPDAAVQTPGGKAWGTAEDLSCAQWLFEKVKIVSPTAKQPNWAQWANDLRLMRVQDERTHREICELFKWANQDTFWSANVLCPKTLRKQWDRLVIQRAQPVGGKPRQRQPEPPMPRAFGAELPVSSAASTTDHSDYRPKPFGE